MESSSSSRIVEFLKDKSILITGSTGFLAKILVEKLLRAQPDVKRLFLLVRATDAASAKHRVLTEITGKELFKDLKDKHGDGFDSFVSNKLFPVAGDIVQKNFGIQDSHLREDLWKEVQIVVNVAATTNFDEGYDVALGINVLGAKHMMEFAKQCMRLEMLLHVSTAYVAGEQAGLILERKFRMGETLKGDSNYLDIEAELRLVDKMKRELQYDNKAEEAQNLVMKELGMKRARFFGWPNTYVYTKAMGEMLLGQLRGNLPLVILRPTIITSIFREPLPGWIEGTRTIDSLIMGYAKGKLSCFFGDPEMVVDVVPGDMVVNAMIAAMVAHSNYQQTTELIIYHMSSSVRNPVTYSTIEQCGFRYFLENPRVGKDGRVIETKRLHVFRNMIKFRIYMTLRYKLPLEVLHLVNFLSRGRFGFRYDELNRKYKFAMHLVDLYEPYAFFKGCFDDINMERLRMEMKRDEVDARMFDFDPQHINWKDYFYGIHIPGVLKYACK